jgi:putative flippase GtrA
VIFAPTRPSARSLHQFARFLCVGGSATALQYLLLIAFVAWLGLTPLTASSISYALSTLYNYMANHAFTFQSDRDHYSALPRFSSVAIIGLALNAAVIWLAFDQFHVHYLVAQLLATALTLGWNFLASRYWAFASRP